MDWLTERRKNIWRGLGRFLDGDWLVGQCHFLLAFFVQWYATEKHKQVVIPRSFLVAQPGRLVAAVVVCALLRPASRHYLRLPDHLAALHAEPDHSLPPKKRAHPLPGLRENLSASIELLPPLRRAAGGRYFAGTELVAGVSVSGIPYFFKTGRKSGCDCP